MNTTTSNNHKSNTTIRQRSRRRLPDRGHDKRGRGYKFRGGGGGFGSWFGAAAIVAVAAAAVVGAQEAADMAAGDETRTVKSVLFLFLFLSIKFFT